MARVFAAAELQRVRKLWPTHSVSAIAATLGCDFVRVKAAGAQLGLPSKRRFASWSADEDALVLARWDGTGQGAAMLAQMLGRTVGSVRSRHCFLVSGKPRIHAGRVIAEILPQGAGGVDHARARVGMVALRDRCPWCEAPPGDPACRHGWDGAMTRAQRRAGAEQVAVARDGLAAMVAGSGRA